MKTTQFTPALLVIAMLLGACNSMPKTTGLLDQTRSDYRVVQNNPQVGNYAAVEMQQASEAMAKANHAADENESTEDIDKLAYLAKQKIALTQEVIKRKTAEAEVASSAKERDQVRLDQRTMEADKATSEMRQAQSQAAFAERQTREAEARAGQLEAQLAALSAKKTERGIVITLSDVLFQTNRALLNQNGLSTLQKVADILQQYPQRTVLVEGFTDSVGSTAHNQKLSERRAVSVRRSLRDMGVGQQRIAIRGFGESFPVASNDTPEDRQLNRRVEIILSNEDGAIRQR